MHNNRRLRVAVYFCDKTRIYLHLIPQDTTKIRKCFDSCKVFSIFATNSSTSPLASNNPKLNTICVQ